MNTDIYYRFIEPQDTTCLGCWHGQTNQYSEVFGYSIFGHVFLRSIASNEFSVLHPFKQSMKQYGQFKSIVEFKSQILNDEGFIEYIIQPTHVTNVQSHVGELNFEEVYIPCPYPMVGGSCEANTYEKGNIWTFLELVGMTHGI